MREKLKKKSTFSKQFLRVKSTSIVTHDFFVEAKFEEELSYECQGSEHINNGKAKIEIA